MHESKLELGGVRLASMRLKVLTSIDRKVETPHQHSGRADRKELPISLIERVIVKSSKEVYYLSSICQSSEDATVPRVPATMKGFLFPHEIRHLSEAIPT